MAQQTEKSALRVTLDVLVAVVCAAVVFTIAFTDWAKPIRDSISKHAPLHLAMDYLEHHKPRVPP